MGIKPHVTMCSALHIFIFFFHFILRSFCLTVLWGILGAATSMAAVLVLTAGELKRLQALITAFSPEHDNPYLVSFGMLQGKFSKHRHSSVFSRIFCFSHIRCFFCQKYELKMGPWRLNCLVITFTFKIINQRELFSHISDLCHCSAVKWMCFAVPDICLQDSSLIRCGLQQLPWVWTHKQWKSLG